MDIKDLIIYKKTVPARAAKYAPFPPEMPGELIDYLRQGGIEGLYTHQAEMFERAKQNENVVITTSTASGKTLGFLLPVIAEILKNPLARAIFIYPTKALASDQYRAIEPFIQYFGENRISAGVYDGDTPSGERSRIRKQANIILTNPEMVNGAFLPNHSKFGFDFIFSNLKYVVIDELHTYRGVFGSHMANLFRRFGRVCRYYGSSPVFLCSSATIANPVELAEEVCGRKFVRIDRDGSPAAERSYLVIKPPKILGHDKKAYGQVSAVSVTVELLPELVEDGKSFIAFAKSRRNVEVVLKETRDRLDGESVFGASMADRISGYRGGYTPNERKEIEYKMVTGAISGLVSTNALELGIDIGKIDATVLTGYPGTRASFWQQTGRAGRSGKPCTNYLILDNLPFDQYIAVNPDWLFENGSESAVVDKNNLLIELGHIRAAAAEIPLTLDDISIFPDLGETIPVLIRAKELTGQNGKFAWSGGSFPAGDYSLRNIDKNRYKLLLKESGREITEMDEMQAFREIHPGAVYIHSGVQYQVVSMDMETRTAFAAPFNGNYYTSPMGNTEISIIKEIRNKEYRRIRASFGDINVNASVSVCRKLQFHSHQNLGYEEINIPLVKTYDTESAWLRLPDNVVSVFKRILQESNSGEVLSQGGNRGKLVRNNHFEGLCYAMKNAARLVTMTEQEDIGTAMSTGAVDSDSYFDEDVFLFLYDQYTGGLGYGEKIYDLLPEVIESSISMVEGCSCEDGCAACVGDYHLDKHVVLWGLKNLLEETLPPKHTKIAPYSPSTFIRKQFKLDQLPGRWDEFISCLRQNGDTYGPFLGTVMKVEAKEKKLILETEQEFYREWVMEETNRRGLTSLIAFYTDVPTGFSVEVRTIGGEERKREQSYKKEKLEKRYGNLKERDT